MTGGKKKVKNANKILKRFNEKRYDIISDHREKNTDATNKIPMFYIVLKYLQ